MKSTFKPNHQLHRSLSYAMLVVMMLIQPLMNGAAAHAMHNANFSSSDNTMMICTGKGMVYIDLQQFWDTGEMHYVNADGSELDAQSEPIQNEMSACELATFAHVDTLLLPFESGVVAVLRYQEQVRARESRAVQTFPYLAASPRAPPAANQAY